LQVLWVLVCVPITFHLDCERLKFFLDEALKEIIRPGLSSDQRQLSIFSYQGIFVPMEDEYDLTPRAAARPSGGSVLFSTPLTTMTRDGFEGGFGVDAGEYGKPEEGRTRLSDVMEEMDVSEDDDGRDSLYFLPRFSVLQLPEESVCCGVISSGQGIRRFCTSALLTGEKTCGVGSHVTKERVERGSFFVKTKVKGGGGAALTSKTIALDHILAEDLAYFQGRRHSPAEWETRFDQAKLAKYGSGKPLSEHGAEEIEDQATSVLDYMPTPKRPRVQGNKSGSMLDSPASPSWVELPTLEEVKLQLMKIRSATEDTSPGRSATNLAAIGHNFGILQDELPKMAESSAASLAELREHFERLATAMQKVDRRLGKPEGFGMLASVTTAFDGLRYLHEVGEERNAQFARYPYERVLSELARMDTQIQSLQTVDRWTEEATELRSLNAAVARSVVELKTKTISSLVQFYLKFTTPGSAIPGDLLSNEVARLQTAVVALEAASGQQLPNAQVGFTPQGHQHGSSAQMTDILARLARTEADNARLTRELQVLQAAPPLAPGAAPGTSSTAPAPSAAFDIDNRLSALEAAGDLESVSIAGQTFKNIQDCETFLYHHVPHEVLDAYAYDFVSMIHRIGRDPSTSVIHRETYALKAGFKTSGSATLFSSFQQVLPGPFGTGSASSSSTAQPIPALKEYVAWDRQDGMTGLKTEVTHGIQAASTSILAAMNRDCQNHHTAKMVFTSMIQSAQMQWLQFAQFLSENYMTSFSQIEDAKEAWLYNAEIAKGTFTELYKVRVVAADRTAAVHNHKDAARSFWVALHTQKLMAEFIELKFTGHPKLSPYSINHLFRHRVPPKTVESLGAKISKVENDLRSVTALQGKMKAKYPV
jgi:hypothetical protein